MIYLDQILSEAIEAEERKRAEIAAKRLAAKERRAARKAGTIKELIAGVNQAQDKFDKVIYSILYTSQCEVHTKGRMISSKALLTIKSGKMDFFL